MTSDDLPNRSCSRRLAAVATALVLTAGVTACGDDDAAADAAYCDSLADARTAFEQYAEVDVVEGGLDSIRQYVDGIEAALVDIREANDARIGTEADAFRAALDDLVTALTTGELPVDRREEVRAAVDEVDRTWNELRVAGEIECPSTAGT